MYQWKTLHQPILRDQVLMIDSSDKKYTYMAMFRVDTLDGSVVD